MKKFAALVILSLFLSVLAKRVQKEEEALAKHDDLIMTCDCGCGPKESSIDILIDQKINYTESIIVTGNVFQEVPYYTRTFFAPRDYPRCSITLSIPFVANDGVAARSRVYLALDEEPIWDNSIHGMVAWTMVPLNFNAHKSHVTMGEHTIKIYAAVDKGTLNIPHFNPNVIENYAKPAIFSTMEVYCQK